MAHGLVAQFQAREAAIRGGFQERRAGRTGTFYLEDGGRRLLPIGISLSDYLDMLIDPLYESAVGPLFRLHGAHWEARGEPGVLADDDVRRFLELALPGLAAAGILRLYGLRFGRDMAGVYLGFFRSGWAYAYLGGFDPAFARESPGTVLIGHAIDEAVRDAATEFHFLRGKEEYKYQWGPVDRWYSRLELWRPL